MKGNRMLSYQRMWMRQGDTSFAFTSAPSLDYSPNDRRKKQHYKPLLEKITSFRKSHAMKLAWFLYLCKRKKKIIHYKIETEKKIKDGKYSE